jgi:hypothetical protein
LNLQLPFGEDALEDVADGRDESADLGKKGVIGDGKFEGDLHAC